MQNNITFFWKLIDKLQGDVKDQKPSFDTLSDTDKNIANTIKEKPGIKGEDLANAVHTSWDNLKKRMERKMPLYQLGYRQKRGQKGYFFINNSE